MMGALNDCEGINLGATASTADRALPVDTKSVYIRTLEERQRRTNIVIRA